MTAEAIRLFLADVDGTLVTSDKVLTDASVDAVRRLRAAGVLFAITSGRPPRGMAMLIEPLGLDTPIAAFNGGLLVDRDMNVLEERVLPEHLVRPIAELVGSFGLDVWIYRGADWYVPDPDGAHVAREAWTVKFQPKVMAGLDGLTDRVAKIVGVSDDRDAVSKATAAAHDRFGDHVTAATSQPYYLDVTHPDANKGTVAQNLAKRYGLSADEIATIGDMPNDVLMFAHSGLSIAMGNADPQVRRAARRTTDTNDDDGFAKAVKRFVLPQGDMRRRPSQTAEGETMNPAQQLHAAGQSLWLDSINRRMLTSGTLAHYVEDLAVTGLTSNPTILGHAMAASSDYDESLRRSLAAGVHEPEDLVYSAALEDLTDAADLFRPVWEATGGADGYVSLEVPPGLAYDAGASIEMARRLHEKAGRPNLLVKIPGTPAGLTAMETLVAEGIGINVTLLFSDTHYLQTAGAYMRALETRASAGQSLDVPSVASLFISRWDKAADPLLPVSQHGRLGLAVANKVYGSYRSTLEDDRWKVLEKAGARPQRVLWASTSTKDPAFPDTYYMGRLAAPNTIDTVPEKTLLAFADHGGPIELMAPDYAGAEACLAEVAAAGIDVDALGESLQRQGAHAFEADWASLLDAIGAKAGALVPS